MKIITLSGLDGSGKSTQTKLLTEYLESQENKVFYFHVINFSLLNRIVTFIKEFTSIFSARKDEFSAGSEPKSVTKADAFSIWLRKMFILIDFIRFRKFKKRLEKDGYDILISDRFFYDSAVNILFLSKSTRKLFAERFLPKADISLYVSTEPEQIMLRERVPDQGLEYLKNKRKLYDDRSKIWSLTTINGNQPQEEVFGDIKRIIAEKL